MVARAASAPVGSAGEPDPVALPALLHQREQLLPKRLRCTGTSLPLARR